MLYRFLLFIKRIQWCWLLCLFVIQGISQNNLQPIGYWREHLNYQNTTTVVQGDKLYCATVNNVFSIDANNDIERYSKVTGLNDMGVSAIGWDNFTKQLVIAYNSSNIDILKGSIVTNIGDIVRSNISGNKTIRSVYCNAGFAYLSTGLGIIVANLQSYDIKDTWIIGSNGNQININACIQFNNQFYAATDEGLKTAPAAGTNLANYSNWTNLSGNNGLPLSIVNNIVAANGILYAQIQNTIYTLQNNQWALWYTDSNWPITKIEASGNNLLICQRTTLGNSRVITVAANAHIINTIAVPNVVSFPKDAIMANNTTWIADYYGGLSAFSNNSYQRYIPNGPLGPASGDMVFNQQTLYVAAGSVNNAWNYLYNRNGIYILQDGIWSDVGAYTNPVLDTTLDFITLATDNRDGSIWAGSYGGGLVQLNGNNFQIYKQSNSSLQPAIGDPTSYRISGLAFDAQNNLWIANYGAAQNLQVLKADGNFKGFSVPFSLTENAVSQIVVDDANQLWIVSPKNNGLLCYNYGNSIDATNDDQWQLLQTGIGKGNLPGNNVYCVAKDKNGFIWIGTDNGIGVIQCATNYFQQPCDAVWPVIQQDQFAGYLFQGQQVKCMAVDGANRKWVGTNNGLWLVSSEGDKILQHFTAANSPLPDNNIQKIAIQPNTGEVFISTFTGISSYRSTATEGTATNDSVLVFPNPVPPGYSGTIAIRGVTENALVKIAELSGRLVYQTHALGRQAVWNGLNYKGEKVASGVYLVLIRNQVNGQEKVATKIVIISGR
ncbi:two-component regulator propeller domain-containing protein [Hydrotalea sp.]|uniref:type IX secretion system anionic LPS delivery protein PorZ n=2 Tax=Hydrotalea sp. TaxID=2881279 RepID=UPI0026240CE9|nr:two-component regulator propeller domain-containing protein [Hydrotalea sp.]